MSKEEQMNPDEFLGGEGIPGVPIYTPKESSRLVVYQNITEKIMEVQQFVDSGEERVFGKYNEKTGKCVEPYFPLDKQFVETWKKKRQSMYDSEFKGNPKLEGAATGIQESIECVFEPQILTPKELNELWNRD